MQEIAICLGKDYAGAPRPNKGQSLLALLDNYVAIDIETTGFDSRFNDIIELAAICVSNGQITGKFQSLVKLDYEIPPYIADLTGISDLMISTAPKLCDALPKFLDFVGDSVVVAHNANFDINFIYDYTRLFDLPPFSNDFVDTCRLSKRAFPEWENHKLETLIRNLGIAETVEHRSLSDCIQAHRCYEAIKDYVRIHDINLSTHYSHFNSMSRHITATTNHFNPDSPVYGKLFVFTGALERMTRQEAMQVVVDAGGQCGDGVTQKTDYLVLGNTDYCAALKGKKSNKQKKAEKLKTDGLDIEIISENVFYDMIESQEAPDADAHRTIRTGLSEAQALEVLHPLLATTIDANNAPHDLLYVTKGRQYTSLSYGSALLCHLHFRNQESFIALTEASTRSLLHIPIQDEEDLTAKAAQITARLDWLIDRIPVQFDCCSRYEQCSDALQCVHPNPSVAIGCRYRRNLKQGKVFYGKNAKKEE